VYRYHRHVSCLTQCLRRWQYVVYRWQATLKVGLLQLGSAKRQTFSLLSKVTHSRRTPSPVGRLCHPMRDCLAKIWGTVAKGTSSPGSPPRQMKASEDGGVLVRGHGIGRPSKPIHSRCCGKHSSSTMTNQSGLADIALLSIRSDTPLRVKSAAPSATSPVTERRSLPRTPTALRTMGELTTLSTTVNTLSFHQR